MSAMYASALEAMVMILNDLLANPRGPDRND